MVAQHCHLMFAVFCCVNLSLDVSRPMPSNFRLRLDETLCARMLLNARTFRDLRCTAQICGASVLDWTAIAPLLEPPRAVLLQTYQIDYMPAAANKHLFAGHLDRQFINDAECEQDIHAFGGDRLLGLYRSFDKGAHKADMWRYIKLFVEGGHSMDIKCALYRPWNETMEAIRQQGTAQQAGQSTAHSEGQGTAQPLIMAIGQAKDHIFQGIILNCPKNHPLFLHAIKHCMQTSAQELTGRGYMRFCKRLYALLTEDLGRQPQPGWNHCSRYGPIYLMHETKERKTDRFLDKDGNEFPVDGHMLYAGDTLFAATRAWKWNHGFKAEDLKAMVVNAAAEAAQLDAGTAKPSAGSLEQGTAQSSTAPENLAPAASSGAASSGAASPVGAGPLDVEVPAADTRVEVPTADECQKLIQFMDESAHYQGCSTREIMALFALGLRAHPTSQGWLGCQHCRNANRKPLHFQDCEKMRKHCEEKHGETPATASNEEQQPAPAIDETTAAVADELRGVWSEEAAPAWASDDAQARLTAKTNPSPAASWSEQMLSQLRQSEGFVGRFIQKVVKVLQARDAGHGPALQAAIHQLADVPSILRSFWNWNVCTDKGLTWETLTQVEVKEENKIQVWTKQSGWWDSNMVKDTAVTGAMMTLFCKGMHEVTAVDCSMSEAERKAASRSICVLFNEASRDHGGQQRLLTQPDGVSLRYEHTPGKASFKYTGKRSLTGPQRESDLLEGRRNRGQYAG